MSIKEIKERFIVEMVQGQIEALEDMYQDNLMVIRDTLYDEIKHGTTDEVFEVLNGGLEGNELAFEDLIEYIIKEVQVTLENARYSYQ